MRFLQITTLFLIALLVMPIDSMAIGRRGGGGGGGRPSFGGGGRPNISAPRPTARPSRPAPRPSMPSARPNVQRPNVQRPNTQRPNIQRPSVQQPNLQRPNVQRPNSQRPNVQRPSIQQPNLQRPPLRPGASRPATRPNLPSGRPNTSLPARPGTRPGVSLPGNKPSRPSTLPGNRPGVSRPTTRPSRPGTGPGISRPGTRPTPGGVGDFLGLDKPLRPGSGNVASKVPNRPTTLPGDLTRPGTGNRPNRPGNRPGIDRPGITDRPNRPNLGDRPNVGNRPNIGDQPNLGDRWSNSNVINQRAGWAKIDNRTNVNIHNRWNSAFDRPGWQTPGVARRGYWNGWGNGVRHGWGHYHRHGGWFNNSWWGRHNYPMCGWHYHYGNHNRPWRYWWTVPAWSSFNNWFAWSAPATVWSEPVYYDYGTGGNVTYQDNSVYIGGTEVATAEEFAQSAMDLATVEPPETEEEAAESEWMPLGTFAVSTDEQDTDPNLTVQLAVNREGVIAGSLYNVETDKATSVQGSVDRETQRVAIRFGEDDSLVAETGLYNLTQDEAPVLVHFGADRTENYLLVRLDAPEEEGDGEAGEEGGYEEETADEPAGE